MRRSRNPRPSRRRTTSRHYPAGGSLPPSRFAPNEGGGDRRPLRPQASGSILPAVGISGAVAFSTITSSKPPPAFFRHWPPTSGVLQTFFAANGGTPAPFQAILPTTVVASVAAMAAAIASALVGSETRPMTFAAISNSECEKPIGWVHGRPVLAVKSAASCAEVWPVSDDLNGCEADQQTSDERVLPASPSVSTDCGKRIALATVTALGLRPCWRAWFEKVVKSGGITTPVTISAVAALNALTCAVKSSERFWERPGSVRGKPAAASLGFSRFFGSPQALPSASLGNSPPTLPLVESCFHMPVETAMMSSRPQK